MEGVQRMTRVVQEHVYLDKRTSCWQTRMRTVRGTRGPLRGEKRGGGGGGKQKLQHEHMLEAVENAQWVCKVELYEEAGS